MPRGLWWLVEGAALLAYLTIPALTLAYYSDLPSTIPTHFGISGAPDGFGHKSTLIFLIIVDTMVFAILSIAPFNPNLINVPWPKTPANIQTVISMIRVLKLEVILFMAYVTWAMIQTALGHTRGLGGIIPLAFIAILFTTIGIGFYLSKSNAD